MRWNLTRLLSSILITQYPRLPRIANAIASQRFLAPLGLYIIANVDPDVAARMVERLKPYFNANFDSGVIVLRHQQIPMPAVISEYTPFSTARIALLGNLSVDGAGLRALTA